MNPPRAAMVETVRGGAEGLTAGDPYGIMIPAGYAPAAVRWFYTTGFFTDPFLHAMIGSE